jgi:hypothetical protein
VAGLPISKSDACALVLAWGVPLPEGLDRWWRVGKATDSHWPYRHPTAGWGEYLGDVAAIEPRGLGEIVIIETLEAP